MSGPLKPVTITFSPNEIISMGGVFGTFSKTMELLEITIPVEVKRDMASILLKMMGAVEEQVTEKAMEN